MNEVLIRGTDDPDDIAIVLALLCRDAVPGPAPRDGLTAWRAGRRAALSSHTRPRWPTEVR